MVPLKEEHSLTFDPRLWERLTDIANRHYEGSRSKAVEGLVLYDWLVETNKAKQGQPHTHWVSAPLVLHPNELGPLMARLLAGDADAVGDWLQRQVAKEVEQALARLPFASACDSALSRTE